MEDTDVSEHHVAAVFYLDSGEKLRLVVTLTTCSAFQPYSTYSGLFVMEFCVTVRLVGELWA